jgi:hypothetical protein
MKTSQTYEKQDNNENNHNRGGYGIALFDPRWKARRQKVMVHDDNKCLLCGSTDNLQVHHRQYHFSKSLNVFRPPWDYSDKYLITLCDKCHRNGHRIYRVPVKTVS